MSRSGYTDDCDDTGGLWRGAVERAIKGKRGQAALRELLEALDAMPVKELISESLSTADGEFCALGVLGAKRGINLDVIDPEDWDKVARVFDIAPAMVREIAYMNDEGDNWDISFNRGPSARADDDLRRWKRMRRWVERNIVLGPGK